MADRAVKALDNSHSAMIASLQRWSDGLRASQATGKTTPEELRRSNIQYIPNNVSAICSGRLSFTCDKFEYATAHEAHSRTWRLSRGMPSSLHAATTRSPSRSDCRAAIMGGQTSCRVIGLHQ